MAYKYIKTPLELKTPAKKRLFSFKKLFSLDQDLTELEKFVDKSMLMLILIGIVTLEVIVFNFILKFFFY